MARNLRKDHSVKRRQGALYRLRSQRHRAEQMSNLKHYADLAAAAQFIDL